MVYNFLRNPGMYGMKKRTGRTEILTRRQKRMILRRACQEKETAHEDRQNLSLPCWTRTVQNVFSKKSSSFLRENSVMLPSYNHLTIIKRKEELTLSKNTFLLVKSGLMYFFRTKKSWILMDLMVFVIFGMICERPRKCLPDVNMVVAWLWYGMLLRQMEPLQLYSSTVKWIRTGILIC